MPLISLVVAPSFKTYAGFSAGIYIIYLALSCYYEDFSTLEEFVQHQCEHFWTDIFLLNVLACAVVLLGRLFIGLVFGPLRAIEQQNLRDKIHHFSLYKFVFLFGVLNLGEVRLVTRWAVWCGGLAVIYLLDKLCKDRADYLSLSPTTRFRHHLPGLTMALTLHLSTVALLLGVLYYRDGDMHITLFLLADVLIHYLSTLYSLLRYGLILYDLYTDRWEGKDIVFYYVELVLEVLVLYAELLHNVHMLLYSGVLLSMGSFVLCMHIKHLYNELCKRWQRHKNFRSIMNSMDSQFRVATTEELQANNDHCAICWDYMESARKLPCGHLFHISCLRSWLEHDTSCPTCRLSLGDPNQAEQPQQPTQQQQRNMAWQFRGSRWASWLPNFSVHVIRAPHHLTLDMRMINQVLEVLPHVPRDVVEDDLRRTLNPQITIENMLQNDQGDTSEAESDEQDNNNNMALAVADNNNNNIVTAGSSTEAVYNDTDNVTDSDLRRRRLLAAVERRWGD